MAKAIPQTPARRSICMCRSAARCAGIAAATPRSRAATSRSPSMTSALRCEIDLVSQQIDRRLKVDHVHFGGGTPTIMAPESFADLIGLDPACLLRRARRPRSRSRSTRARFARQMIEALALGGVNRASLGVQSFDPRCAARHQPLQSFEADGRRDQRPAARRHRRHQFRPDLRAAAPDRCVLPRHRRALRRAAPRPLLGVRLRACPVLQEASAQDRGGVAARQPRAASTRPRRSPTRCGGRLCADRARSFRAARATDGGGAAGRHAAPEFPGLHHGHQQRPARLRRQRDRPSAAGLCAERGRHARVFASHRGRAGSRPSRAMP